MVLNAALRPGNRFLLLVLACATLILVPTWWILRDSFDSPEAHAALWAPGGVQTYRAPLSPEEQIAELVLHGGVIMPKLGNETVKAELGRASWKLLRESPSRFPPRRRILRRSLQAARRLRY